jgi:SAM-dependent methyltransferase
MGLFESERAVMAER